MDLSYVRRSASSFGKVVDLTFHRSSRCGSCLLCVIFPLLFIYPSVEFGVVIIAVVVVVAVVVVDAVNIDVVPSLFFPSSACWSFPLSSLLIKRRGHNKCATPPTSPSPDTFHTIYYMRLDIFVVTKFTQHHIIPTLLVDCFTLFYQLTFVLVLRSLELSANAVHRSRSSP